MLSVFGFQPIINAVNSLKKGKSIKNVNQNVKDFNKPLDEVNLKNQNVILFSSKNSCVSCHQMGNNDENRFGNLKQVDKTYYFPRKKSF